MVFRRTSNVANFGNWICRKCGTGNYQHVYVCVGCKIERYFTEKE